MKRENKIGTYIRYGTKEQAEKSVADFKAEFEKQIAPRREQLIQQVREALDKKSKRR